MARVILVAGEVRLVRPGVTEAARVSMETVLCPGDSVRVQKYGTAVLRLANETALRLDQGTMLTLVPPAQPNTTLLQQLIGRIHVITRTPQPFGVKTPFVNANIQGTEFTVEVSDSAATVSVVEGVVLAANDMGSERLRAGQVATARANGPPRLDVALRPRDAVTWALHFPTVFDPGRDTAPATGGPDGPLADKATELYRAGKIAEALEALDQAGPSALTNIRTRLLRASLLLLVGRADEARALVEDPSLQGTGDGDALALQAIISLIEGRPADVQSGRAFELARRAVERAPRSATTWLALSYVEQSQFNVDRALVSTIEAIRVEPQNALAQARRAELEMSLGNLDAALAAAQMAAQLGPDLSRTQSVLGFANLLRIDMPAARRSFERAIELDPTDPLPRLGQGLARIREGDLAGGRADMETAAILDPLNALVRSYLGKAYFEERRSGLAAEQFELAQAQDPQDPTPWFYDAIRLLVANQPIDAQRALRRSIELNDNRAVVRSRLLLDDDRAVRSTGLAALYGVLGFERLAIVESVKALADNMGNSDAHRQLAAAYGNLPRHDIARVSEALQAEIRQPLSLTPIDPQLSTDNLGILRGTGPARLGANEFNELFARDQLRVQFDAIGGSRGTSGDQLLVSGVSGRLGYGLSQLHYETDGFRENSQSVKNALDLFLQGQLAPTASVQLHLKETDFKLGETFLPFDASLAFPVLIKERSQVARLSSRVEATPASEWIVSLAREQRRRGVDYAPDGSLVTQTDARTHAAEVQYLGRLGDLQLIAGGELLRGREAYPEEAGTIDSDSRTLYAYGLWRVTPKRLTLQLGVAAEHVDIHNSLFDYRVARRRVSPKLGVLWTPTDDTTVRAATFTSVKRPFIASQTLEPTQVAGFNQFFTGFDTFYGDPDGTVSRRVGLGIDQRIGQRTFAGAEVTARRLAVPSFIAAQDFRWNERTAHLYFYGSRSPDADRGADPGWSMAHSIEYEYENIVRPQILTGPEGIVHVATHHVPIGLRLYKDTWTVRVGTTYVRQRGEFSADINYDRFPRSTSGWLTDLSAEYRLPNRAGVLTLGVRNAFNRSLDLFQVDPFSPRDAIGRFTYARLRLVY